MSIDGVVQVNRLFEGIPVLSTFTETWFWFSSNILTWLLPFSLLLLFLLFPLEKSVRLLNRWKAAFLLAFWMTWACWFFPAGQWLWDMYLSSQGVICQ